MSVQINDLSFDLLKYIFEFLPDKHLFAIESVCIHWKKCVNKLLGQKQVLFRLDQYSSKFKNQDGGQRIIINDNNIEILKKILTKYSNIKQLNLSDTKVTGNNNLIAIANLCPKLQRINLTGCSIEVSQREINEFAKLIGPKLIKCDVKFVDNFTLILLENLKSIEKLDFNSFTTEQNKLFHYLNVNGKNLSTLKWNCSRQNFDFENQDLIDVLQRIKHLKISLSFLLKSKFEMDNLTKLTIYQNLEFENKKIEMTFNNLRKLKLINISDANFMFISEFKFPKLESVKIINEFYYDIPKSFIQQIRHIKTLEYECGDYSLIPSMVLSIDKLTNFIWRWISLSNEYSYSQLYQCFDLLSQNETLKNIEFWIYDPNMDIDVNFYEKLFNFCKAKPNTKVKIFQYEITHKPLNLVFESKADTKINNYKKQFDEAKRLHKLNMDLIYTSNSKI